MRGLKSCSNEQLAVLTVSSRRSLACQRSSAESVSAGKAEYRATVVLSQTGLVGSGPLRPLSIRAVMAVDCPTPVRYRPSAGEFLARTSIASGKSYIDTVHVRARCLYSRVRASRGRTKPAGSGDAGLQCEVCNVRQETLAHVIQQCSRSAHARDQRHNAVSKLLTKRLTASGFTVEVEPAVKICLLYTSDAADE